MENYVLEYLNKKGYTIDTSYYSKIENWINEWKGKAGWLQVQTIDNKPYPMYSLGMAKRLCEDLSSTICSEPFNIKAKKQDKLLQERLKEAKVLSKLPNALEIMGYTGTVATVTRIFNAETDGTSLTKNNKTKIRTIDIKANQIYPLTIEDGEIINCAFVSEQIRQINGKTVKVIYLELHELLDKGYQVTNKFFNKNNGSEITIPNIIETYNTLSQVPLFSICKLPKTNVYDNNNGLGMSIFGDSEDQLQILDLTYNNFGMDFKLGQKLMVINKKLTRIENEDYEENGVVKTRQKVLYPSDLQKQQFMDISDGLLGTGTENPYVYEYNPDLRVGDNKNGIQFALDTLSFKAGYGTHYYSFENGNVTTATEAVLSRSDFVSNGKKIRDCVNQYLIGVCKSLLLCEKMLGSSVDENIDIDIAEVDGFLEDDGTTRTKLLNDFSAGLISKTTYLKKVYNMTDEEVAEELDRIKNEDDISSNIDNNEV